MKNPIHTARRLSTAQIVIFAFASVILLGTLLLMLPISSASGKFTSFSDAAFTATSAVCVTGLVVHDTATYWSVFGQAIILLMIQIGGMGVVTVAVAIAAFSGKKIGLSVRSLMQDSISAPKVGGIVRLTGFILKAVLIFEICGTVALLPAFCSQFGARGIWMSAFHSISAFCNAGFDLMGSTGEYSSLTTFVSNPLVNVVIMLLIVIGGIGFLTWEDIVKNRWHISKYRLQSRVVLLVSALLIILPAIYLFFYEFSAYPMGKRIAASLFSSVTTRTAGFNTVDFGTLSSGGKAIMIVLMLIGGSPGSTAGGMKTTTVAVLFASAIAVFRRKDSTKCFNRRLEDSAIKNAAAILLLYITLFFGSAIIISAVEGLPLDKCLFETASAIGTVGLSLGITPSLGLISRLLLMILMFFGRVGGLTLIFAAVSANKANVSKLPQEKITVG